jgi:hypothetical protein
MMFCIRVVAPDDPMQKVNYTLAAPPMFHILEVTLTAMSAFILPD